VRKTGHSSKVWVLIAERYGLTGTVAQITTPWSSNPW
jgi:hypothetical protein